ncbi:MAG TPA: GNAT family N-acetyltransferase [Pyrinomonadaceae bacterium]|nr:GNAT family N-acetyltransferase [Pyrinomonadaceae bacterium]
MPDLLVNLMKLESRDSILLETDRAKVVVRRAEPFELTRVRSFVEKNFSVAWADEISVGFTSKPVSVYLAVVEREIVGFAAYECTRRSFFGPTGVIENMQGRGIGKALLLACLWGLRELGYVYAIIGRAGPVEFYEKTVGAIVIPDSDPGIYTNLLS